MYNYVLVVAEKYKLNVKRFLDGGKEFQFQCAMMPR
jgi:hypothetical protein